MQNIITVKDNTQTMTKQYKITDNKLLQAIEQLAKTVKSDVL